MKPAVKRIIFFAALIVFWELGSRFELWHETILPSPVSVYDSLVAGFADMTLVYDLIASFRRLLIGLVAAVIIGTGVCILLARSKTADETLGTLVLALQST